MTESRPIECGRERTLQFGLTLDLLPHLPALLTYFGDLKTIDEIEVSEASQYDPLECKKRDDRERKDITHDFANETFSQVKFTFEDYSGNGFRVPCNCIVGKGVAPNKESKVREVKYFQCTGRKGHAIRLDLNKPPDDIRTADKKLIKARGPILLAYYDNLDVYFTINRSYVDNPKHAAGVRLGNPLAHDLDRRIRVPREARLDLGALLYEQLTQNPDVIGRFARFGLNIKKASPEAVLTSCSGYGSKRLYVSLPLRDITRQGTAVNRYFFPEISSNPDADMEPATPRQDEPASKPGLPRGDGIAATVKRIAEEKAKLVQLEPLEGRSLQVLVEGAGDWVDQCYRKLFKDVSDSISASGLA